jgi:hypothetical protein
MVSMKLVCQYSDGSGLVPATSIDIENQPLTLSASIITMITNHAWTGVDLTPEMYKYSPAF